jgi:hypothetical protein
MTERACGGRMELEAATGRAMARRRANFREKGGEQHRNEGAGPFACLPMAAQTPPAAPVLQWSACPDVPKTGRKRR